MTRNTITRVVGLVFALIAVGVGTTPAAAQGPVRTPLINMPGELDGFCSFPIDVSFPVNDESSITFYDSAGNPVKTLVDGHLVVTFTNVSDPAKSVTLNLSGPGIIVYNPDGSQTITFVGNSGVFLLQGSQPTLLITSGRVITIVPSGSLTGLGTLVSAVGRETNVCGLLA